MQSQALLYTVEPHNKICYYKTRVLIVRVTHGL